MKGNSTREAFQRLLDEGGLALDRLTVLEGLGLFFAFYRNQRAEDCAADTDCDMLLYQWGIVNDDKLFEFDITRQLIIGGDCEDENIWQLSLNFKFTPTDILRGIPSGNKWCRRPRPQAVDYFEGFVRESAAYLAVHDTLPLKVSLDYFNAG
jgi:hypothetical protein